MFLTFSIGYSAEIKKDFYLIGGGGEPKGDKTIFDNDLKTLGSFVNGPSWDTTISFNGGHKKTEDIIGSKLSKAKNTGPFIEKNYNALIDEMINKIESGKLNAGDQLMLVIDTHGAKNSNEKTHQIALGNSTAANLTTLSGASTVNLDRLEKLATLASAKGVKLAVVDMSCFSGNLLNIKNDKTCFISATGSEQYGYAGTMDLLLFNVAATFSGKFYDLMKEGKNLEEIFLKARTRGDAPDFPMISSPEGIAINELLYKMITPYLNYNDNQTSNFSAQYPKSGAKFENKVCSNEQNHEKLKDLLAQFENMSAVTTEISKNNFSTLKLALEEYRNYQKTYEASLRGKFETEKEISQLLESNYSNSPDLWKGYAPFDLLGIDYDYNLKFYQGLLDKESSSYSKKMWQDMLTKLAAQKELTANIKNKLSESSKNKLKEQEDAYAKSGITKNLAQKVSSEAKKVYEDLYKQQMKKSNSNPCRDFVL
jgi:hypothetical protein